MSLADRIKTAQTQPNSSNDGCRSCLWMATVDADTLKLINEWIAAKNSGMQLHDILSTPGEDCSTNLLDVSYSAWRGHLRHHLDRWSDAK